MQAATKIDTGVPENAVCCAGKYLSFFLAGEEFGIGIRKVKEIIGVMPITPVPITPEHMKGVINLRGMVIPVADLRMKFGMEHADVTERTCIIVVEITMDSREIAMGLIVDAVSEVLNIKATEIEAAPSFGSNLSTSYILGMAKTEEGVKILLDIDKVMGSAEIENLHQTIQ